ncbi:hypothetical protein MVEN_01662600 [Mycena venus]|uniref:Uncharacterized protein n=1 Tax=Mycena venus TaxID=2733690 RepID=A0A8H7CRN5_9AGAR|nr:hypothetical protein MVEN_01662600 [Mycena venus]
MGYYALSILLIQLFVAPCIHALGILLPLYIYPDTNCAAWSPVSAAISANPNVQWYIIINPNSGPGSTDPLYQSCVSQLPASTNQITMGFVDTKAGNVLGDIDTYAGWPSSSRPHGIYLDNISPTANQLSTYESYISHAKSQGFSFIGLDPGQTVAESSYFSIADLINTYEDSYSSFNADSLSGTISKQSVILVNSPSTGSYSTVISQLQSKGVAAVYISTVSDSSSNLPAQLSEFASEVASVGGGGTSSGSTGSSDGTTGSNSNGSTSNGSTSNGSASSSSQSGSDPSNPSIPVAPGSSSSSTAGASAPAKSPPSSLSKSPSQSTASPKGGLETSSGSVQSPVSSGSPSVTNPNQPTAATHKGPPVAAIVGGVLGALIVLLVLLVIFLCMRRRHRTTPGSAPPEAVVPFTEVNRNSYLTAPVVRDPFDGGSTTSEATATAPQSWNRDVKAPLPGPVESTSGDNTTMAADRSVTTSYLTTPRLSAAPTYGSAWESLAGTSGPPPSYHN